MSLDKHIARAKKLSDEDLHRDIGAYVPGSDIHVAAKIELARREDKKAFWRKDIVAWLALVMSAISLFISLFNGK